jgi:hypothetical protein
VGYINNKSSAFKTQSYIYYSHTKCKEELSMSHIDKKNNQQSKKLSQKTKKQLDKVDVETAKEIGVFTEAKKTRKN